jgi:hypothetical protein
MNPTHLPSNLTQVFQTNIFPDDQHEKKDNGTSPRQFSLWLHKIPVQAAETTIYAVFEKAKTFINGSSSSDEHLFLAFQRNSNNTRDPMCILPQDRISAGNDTPTSNRSFDTKVSSWIGWAPWARHSSYRPLNELSSHEEGNPSPTTHGRVDPLS